MLPLIADIAINSLLTSMAVIGVAGMIFFLWLYFKI
jgi:hypothetical protein